MRADRPCGVGVPDLNGNFEILGQTLTANVDSERCFSIPHLVSDIEIRGLDLKTYLKVLFWLLIDKLALQSVKHLIPMNDFRFPGLECLL